MDGAAGIWLLPALERATMDEFGDVLRELRLAAGYGLRQFAKLVGELPSNLSATERNSRPPPRTMDKLRIWASALALEEGSTAWDRFFIAARRPDALPQEVERLTSRPLNLAALRTIDAMELSDDQLEALIEHIKKEAPKYARQRKSRRAR
jgi:transcriptional regulator with XRE-family HTH domain